MAYEPEQMTVEAMKSLLDCAYNEVTFKNALVCALDWANWYHCTHIHKDVRIPVDDDGYRISKYTQVSVNSKYKHSTDTSVVSNKLYFKKIKSNKYEQIRPVGNENPSTEDPWWYDLINPSDNEHSWYEKKKFDYEYNRIPPTDLNYYDNPYINKWYEQELSGDYVLSRDNHATGIFSPVVNVTIIDNPKENGWYELVNDSYQLVDISTYLNPKEMGLYEKTVQSGEDIYFLTEDMFYDLNKTYYVWNGNTSTYSAYVINPHELEFYEYNTSTGVYSLSSDTVYQSGDTYYIYVASSYVATYDKTPMTGKTYYECDYKPYYKRITRANVSYILTEDTIVDLTKTYYYVKNEAEWRDMPDYSDKYVRNIDLYIPGVENEITLQNKRPAHLGG